jgi:hypothetical protein
LFTPNRNPMPSPELARFQSGHAARESQLKRRTLKGRREERRSLTEMRRSWH